MHLLVRERSSLDEEGGAVDLALPPEAVLFASHSDADLAMMAGPGVACAAVARLAHPMSVDLLAERCLPAAAVVAVRLLGGIPAWRYGVDELARACRAAGARLVLLAGDACADPALAARSTVDPADRARLDALLRAGGRANWDRARRLLRALASGDGADPGGEEDGDPEPVAPHGVFLDRAPAPGAPPLGRAAIVLYRSHVLSNDAAPVEALADALAARGIASRALFVGSPRAPADARWLAAALGAFAPDAVLNATCFSARDERGESALESPGVPVLQLVMAGADADAFARDRRGLGPADLAMQVLLPELDGRLATGVVSVKAERDGARRNAPLAGGVALAADRAAGWIRLARTARAERRIAIVLSDYPGAAGRSHAVAHAVGLDGFASLARILGALAAAGYDAAPAEPGALVEALCRAPAREILSRAALDALEAGLPAPVRCALRAAHGEARGPVSIAHHRIGRVVLAVQPPRAPGGPDERRAGYHDRGAMPGHDYVGFHLWLREVERVDAIVHLGTHGTLEWLPGRPDAATDSCPPAALIGGLPVLYPFIVNNPGEAAAAKRRLGAVAIGHLTPPLVAAGLSGEARAIERLLDELAACDGVDRRRATRLAGEIAARARDCDLLGEAGIDPADPDPLPGLDAYLCDVKEMRIADGLHVFGAPPVDRAAMLAMVGAAQAAALDACAGGETAALLAGLDGRAVPPGPAGAPCPARADVLPTGRNLTGSDVRLLPTATASAFGRARAEALLARHLQDEGEWPRTLVLDLWGSSCLRTGGEDLAAAFALIGATPTREDATGRLDGVEIEPLATLGRPRVDVALRVSGLFRDLFPTQIALFDRACRRIAARGFESEEDNPLAARAAAARDAAAAPDAAADAPCRVFGPAPGAYGVEAADWLAGSAFGYGGGRDGRPEPAALAALVRDADGFVHNQDLASTDVLDGPEHAAHEGGFAVAAAALGARPALYHVGPGEGAAAPIRALDREVARAVRGRLANPAWLAGMRRHGYRGASEMARGVEALLAFARALPQRFDRQFELAADAILRDADNRAFLDAEGPEARSAIERALEAARNEGLWHPRRNRA